MVTESPSIARTRAPWTGRTPGGSCAMSSKNGGFFTYVESSDQANVSPVGTSSAAHRSSPSKTFAYWARNMSLFTDRKISCSTSAGDGQMSRRKTGPLAPTPNGSVFRSTSIRPASAYATTSGGEAR